MSEQVSRVFRSSISMLFLFGALAVGGVAFGYLAATWSDAGSLTSSVDAQPAPAGELKPAGNLLARIDPAVR